MSQLQQDDANQADGLQAYKEVSFLAAVVWRIQIMGQYDILQSAARFAQVIGKLIEMIRFCCSG
jgi:hypothetical protein